MNPKSDTLLLLTLLLIASAAGLVYVLTNTAAPDISSISPQTQVAQISGAGSGLVGHWTFDEGSGTTAGDSSGSGKTANLVNGTTWVAGKIGGGAVSLDGTDDTVSVPSLVFSNNSFSFSFWMKGSAGNVLGWTTYRFCGKDHWSNLYIKCTVDGDSSGGAQAATNVFDGAWHHVVFNSTATSQEIYVDGVSKATASETLYTGSGPLLLGVRPSGSSYFNGSLDDVRVYNRVLTPSEISELYAYTGSGTPPEPPPIGGTGTPPEPPPPGGDTTPPPAPTTYNLTVNKSGTGSGTVTGGSINCGATCTQSGITSGTTITLTASASSGSTFAGWSGGCTGTGTCALTMSSNTTVTATFNSSLPGVRPAAPTDFRVTETYWDTANAYKNMDTYMYWTDNSNNEDGFVIERRPMFVGGPSGEWVVWQRLGPGSTGGVWRTPLGHQDSQGVAPWINYQYKVRAFKGSEYSVPSNVLEFTAIWQPTYCQVYTTVSDAATLQWRPRAPDATGYNIERSDDGGATFQTVTKRLTESFTFVPGTSPTRLFIDNNGGAGLPTGTMYIYRISGYNDVNGGNSPYCYPAHLPIAPGMIPNVPGITLVLGQEMIGGVTSQVVTIAVIDNSNNEKRFEVERSTDGITWTSIGGMNTSPSPRIMNDRNLQAGQSYYYRAYATNDTGRSAYVVAPLPVNIPVTPPTGVTEWYVWKGATGPKSGESWQNAWRDVDEINWSAIKPGHTIYISGGDYGKDLTVSASGAEGNPITIRTGALAPNPSGHDGQVGLKGIRFAMGGGGGVVNWITIDGSRSLSFVPTSALDVTGNINIKVSNSTEAGIYSTNAIGLNIRYVEVLNTGTYGIYFNGPTDYSSVYGCHIHTTGWGGIGQTYPSTRPVYDAMEIQFCLIEYTADDLIQTAGNATINDNIMRYNNPTGAGHADGIQGLGSNYLKIYNNQIYDRSKSSYFFVNRTHRSGTFGHNQIYNNLFYYTDQSTAPITEGIYLDSMNTHEPGRAYVPEATWDDILIANNTFVNFRQSVIAFGRRADQVGKVNVRNLTIANNIMYNTAWESAGAPLMIPGVAYNFFLDRATIDIRDNLITGGVGEKMTYDGVIYNTPEEFNTGTGFTGNSSQLVQFVNLSGADYRPASTDTAALNTGTNLSSVFNFDFLNLPRNVGGVWDRGAYEYQGTMATSPSPSGLVLSLDFEGDNFASGIFSDKSDKDNDADCQTAFPMNGTNHNQCPASVAGAGGGTAARFTGNTCNIGSDYLAVPKDVSFDDLRQGTISLFVAPSEFSYLNSKILDTFTLVDPNTWLIGRDGDPYYTFTANMDDGTETDILLFPGGSSSNWTHYAITWDGTSFKGYYNGNYFGSKPMTGFSGLSLGHYLAVGALKHNASRNTPDSNNCVAQYGAAPGSYVFPNAGFFTGNMDDVRMYNRALSASEISSIARTVSAPNEYILNVVKSGTGSGSVLSSPSGVGCGKRCAESYSPGTSVTLSVTPDSVSTFTGWSGACSGTGACSVSMNGHKTVTATFNRSMPTVAQFEAESGSISLPFRATGGVVSQGSSAADPAQIGSGRASYAFTLSEAGDYIVVAKANAPSQGSNSFFVNIDAEPTAVMTWHMSTTGGFEDRVISWGGSSSGGNPAKVFTLSAGAHNLIIRGREGGTSLDSISVLKVGGTVPGTLPMGSLTPDTTPPVISLTSPTAGATVNPSAIIVSASASDPASPLGQDTSGMAGVQFKVNGLNLESEDTTPPYSVTWNASSLPDGSYTLSAVARDVAGNLTTSAPVTVTLSTPIVVDTDRDNDGVDDSLDLCPSTPAFLVSITPSIINSRGCPLPKMSTFSTRPTLTSTDLRSVASLELGNAYAKVSYPTGSYSLVRRVGVASSYYDRLDIDANLHITQGSISLDSAHLPELNRPATLTFYGVTVTKPVIIKDGVICSACTHVIYDSVLHTLSFDVPSFSTYSISFLSDPDTTPPSVVNDTTPSSLPAGTTNTTLSVTTSEEGTCKYSTTAGTTYSSMTNNFSTTNNLSHSATISGLTNGQSYSYFVRCEDQANNATTTDLTLSFSVANPAPSGGTPPDSTPGGGTPSGGSSGGGGGTYVPDQCLNISGHQYSVPTGYTKDTSGNCSNRLVTVTTGTSMNQTTVDPSHLVAYFTPQATQSFPPITKWLKLGMLNSEVKILQQILNALNYIISPAGAGSKGQESTYFGPATERALRSFQCKVIGVCSGTPTTTGYGATGPRTRTVLNSAATKLGTIVPPTTVTPPVTPVGTTGTFTRTLKLGMTGTDVRNLQVFLNTQGFTVSLSGPGSRGQETTYFGPATHRALIKFQETYAAEILTPNGLTRGTGFFGESTMRKVNGM